MSPIVQRGRQSERGQVVILVVLALAIFLLGFVGLATDYSAFWFERQSIQGAADATCQSTAMDLLLSAVGEPTGKANFTLGTAFTCNSAPTAAPCVIAKYNGYDGTVAGNTVSVSLPSNVTCAGAPPTGVSVPYVKLDITRQVPAYFTRLLTARSTVAVHASASCGLIAPNGPVPLLVLNPTANQALQVFGSASINIIGGTRQSVQVNSSSTSAASVGTIDLSQAGPNETGGDFGVFGGPSTQSSGINLGSSGHYNYPTSPLADPYRLVPVPAQPSTAGNHTTVAYKTNGCPDSGGCDEYTAGYYPGAISIKNTNAIFDPGLYYVVGGMTMGPNTTVRVSTANGDGSGGVVIFFSGTGTISVDANSGKKPTTDAYYLNGQLSPNGVASRAMVCPGSSQTIPSQLPASVNGNILLGPCTGPYADPSGTSRGFVFFQDRSAGNIQPTWGGGGQFLVDGFMYFHECRSDGTGLNCSAPGSGGYGVQFGMRGNACSGSYMVGSLVTDTINIGGTPCINMILNPAKSFPGLNVAMFQ